MAKKFELNREGVRELLRSPEMEAVLVAWAGKVAARAGEGYDVHTGPRRLNVSVRTETEEAAADNLEHNTLEKAVRA